MTVEKIIGKGAFSQVAKGTAINLRGRPGKTLLAIKKLKGEMLENIKNNSAECVTDFLAFGLGRLKHTHYANV